MMRLFVLGMWMVAVVFGCQIDEGPDRQPGVVGAGVAGTGGSGAEADSGGMPVARDGGAGAADGAANGSAIAGGGGGAIGSGGAGGAPMAADSGVAVTVDGGGGDGGGGTSPSVCDGAGTRVLTASQTKKIDNFEGGRLDPGWATFSDVAGAPNAAKMTIQAGGALNTAHAGHYAGSGAKTPAMGGYGVGAVFNIAIDVAHGVHCVDISAFDGVSFWARLNPAGGGNKTGNQLSVNFVLPETNAASAGGDCPDASKKCYNHPRKAITLTNNWTQFTVTFAEATGGSASVRGRIQELAFLSPDSGWGYDIDEIQLFKGAPPGGPAGP